MKATAVPGHGNGAAGAGQNIGNDDARVAGRPAASRHNNARHDATDGRGTDAAQQKRDWYKRCRDRVYGVIDAKPGARRPTRPLFLLSKI
jgi:hypothetical protein